MAAILFGALTLAVLYWFPMRRWFRCWGSTATDLTRVMAGDAAVADPTCSATLALTVEAQPEQVWPWLRVIGPAAFLMTRRMLLGLKQRAEALAAAPRDRSSHAA